MREKLPKQGDIRYKIKFAWLPILIGDHKVWLERYYIIQQYHRTFAAYEGTWVTMETGLLENMPHRLDRLHNNIDKG